MTAPPDPTSGRFQLLVCDGPSCGVTHESERLVQRLQAAVAGDPALAARVLVGNYTCFGRCDEGPNMFCRRLEAGDDPDEEPDGEVLEEQRGFYPTMDEDKILRVLQGHCAKGQPLEDLVDDY